ncbi:MAG: ParB/RepB/Spo0J family partition protein [Eubacteriales bacterium]|nr:ParB/RepB/Spo0J family partition protein [Eubacteriales bacterium]
MKSKSAQKIKLTSYDELFGNTISQSETVTSVPLDSLHSFKDHPFHVNVDEKMQETVESVKKYGVLVPGIVRTHEAGGYEVIAGHRRWKACELAGLDEMPVIIRELDDDEATIIMVDTNIQREDILPSEKAFAYKMKYEAMKHQGSKGDRHTADEVGEAAGESGRTVQRYIRLTSLVTELLQYVDNGRIPMTVGEKLSYLKNEEQNWIAEAIGNSGIFPSKAQAQLFKELSENGKLSGTQVYAILIKKEKESKNLTIPAKKISSYFPENYSKTQIEQVIYSLLEKWKESKGEEGTKGAEDSV